MMKINISLISTFVIFFAFAAEAQDVKMLDGVRNARYCEILVVKGSMLDMTATVYNTLGVNACPDAQWKAIDPAKLEKDLAAKSIMMNGPRHFMMDEIGQSNAAPPTVNLGGLEFKERATLGVSLLNLVMGKAKPYEETRIRRSTAYVFKQGRMIYQLISPSDTYVMQSYAQIVDPTLSEADLEHLGARLKLPSGWQYKAVVLDHDLVLKTIGTNEAHITQDDLQNTYQRIER